MVVEQRLSVIFIPDTWRNHFQLDLRLLVINGRPKITISLWCFTDSQAAAFGASKLYSRGQLLRTSFRKNFEKISKMARGSKCQLRTRNQNDGVLSSHLEPLSTRYLEPPPCCNGYQSKDHIYIYIFFLIHHISSCFVWIKYIYIIRRIFQQFFIYMPKNTKRIPLPNAAIPLVNPILRTSLCVRFGISTWLQYLIQTKHDEIRWIIYMSCFFRGLWHPQKQYIYIYIRTKQTCKKDTSSKCSHTLGEPHT